MRISNALGTISQIINNAVLSNDKYGMLLLGFESIPLYMKFKKHSNVLNILAQSIKQNKTRNEKQQQQKIKILV